MSRPWLQQLELSLSLPGSPRPLDAKGTVGPRNVESAKESGFWVQFDELSDDGSPPVKTRAEVVHSVSAAQARRSGRVAGAGLQFIDAGDDFRQRVDACIEALSD